MDNKIGIQRFIDNTFYYILVFSLIFGVVFYDITEGFKFIDELCAGLLCLLYGYYVFHTPNWSVNKFFLTTLGFFFFYLVYSFQIHCNVKAAIISDFIIQLKPYLAFFTVYAFAPRLNKQMKKNVQLLAIVFSVYLLIIGVIGIFDPSVISILLGHTSRLATASSIMAMLYLYSSDYTSKDRLIFLILLSVGLLSLRSKAYGFFVISMFAVFYVNNTFKLKFNVKNIGLLLCVLLFTVVIAWEKIDLYFIQGGFGGDRETSDLYARMALYYFSMDIFTDYFPFGSGFATYATVSSATYYSPLYNKYGMDLLFGLTEDDPKFMADTYYPALAQFGVVGAGLFFLFWVILVRKVFKCFSSLNLKNFTVSLLIIGFFLIECTSDSTFTHNRGMFMMILLALSLREMKRLKTDNQRVENL